MAVEVPTIRVIAFRTEYVRKPGSAELVARDIVEWAPIHNLNQVTPEIVSTLIPPENGLPRDDEGLKMGQMQAKWRQIEPAYRARKQGSEIPLDGVPLGAWSALNPAQVQIFRSHGIKTVEEIAKLTDSMIGKIMLPNLREIKSEAQLFLDSRGATETAGKIAELERQNAAMQEQLKEAMQMLADRAMAEDDKPRRGRPRKAEEPPQEEAA